MAEGTPFKFLDPYGKEDSGRFFGRAKETAQLYNAVYASNLALLYGPSGTGKTSLVKCGLANKFYDTDWMPLFIKREDNLLRSMEDAMRSALLHPPGREDPAYRALPAEEKARLVYLDHFCPVYLIFDQFEELFIQGDKNEQARFYEAIRQLLKSGLQVKVLLIIREEWFAYLNEFEKRIPNLLDNRIRLERMSERNIIEVLLGTTSAAGIRLEEPKAVVQAILRNLWNEQDGIALTNLQIYLDRLYQQYRSGHPGKEEVVFSPALAEKVGAMKNALSTFLDEQLEILESRLSAQFGIAQPRGIPLEVLFTMVTNEKTKMAMTTEAIYKSLPKNRKITEEVVDFCLKEFNRLRLIDSFK
ncbi:MAG: ATP-binding protein [Lewinellaceae bacterium]|nr:ATP-binding protein [Lewinellaceae bacterium]MCB9286359.1 ATP-binding protein [Lewinellaceae bacterium]